MAYAHDQSQTDTIALRAAPNRRKTALVVKGDPEVPEEAPSLEPKIRICPDCGLRLPATSSDFCPVCILRRAAGGEIAMTEKLGSGSGSTVSAKETDARSPARRFEHYELVLDENDRPVELGRGAMGITYKALDVDLRCPVTLKVISERYVGDQSARLRFLREARAAASVRHPNVASVFHLGRIGKDYFYAMEYVEGETLGDLIKRSGRLEPKVALEITSQVAAGLAAVHEQNLVHRDIKPTNIMVSLKGGGRLIAKIIDLGLAKGLVESDSQSAISTAGTFVGTPDFASPEQFAGVGVDIRSDLYSLGVTLWLMLASQAPFSGSPDQVMYQHLHAPLPLEQLKGVPEPVIVLLEGLLEKNPARRYQTPGALLKVMPTITSAIDELQSHAWVEFEEGQRVAIRGQCSMGRSSRCTVVILAERVSRRHAMIHVQDNGECWLIDLGSTNGTFCNEQRVSHPVRLFDGDRLEIGGSRLLFRQLEEVLFEPTYRKATDRTVPEIANIPLWLLIAYLERLAPLSTSVPEETLAMVVGRWFASCKEIVEQRGGKINKYWDDGFLACWNLENESLQKVATALAELKNCQIERAPPFRVAIHCGIVMRSEGAPTGEENLLGKEINFVFRMGELASSLAIPVLLSEQAASRLGDLVQVRNLDRHELKGLAGDFLFFHG
jgi:class 3 adenylate cyclase